VPSGIVEASAWYDQGLLAVQGSRNGRGAMCRGRQAAVRIFDAVPRFMWR
jgi:hypothetical protein